MFRADKHELTQTDRAVHVAVPRATDDRHAAHIALRTHIVDTGHKGLLGGVPSGDSFYAALYDSMRHHEAAVRRLRATPFNHGNKAIALRVSNFGSVKRSTLNRVLARRSEYMLIPETND